MIAKLLHANTRYLALVILAILVVGYTSMSGMARKEDPAGSSFRAIPLMLVYPTTRMARITSAR